MRKPDSKRPVRPVEALTENATALEAAVLEAIAAPKPKAVHKIRTTTRRIEAQLKLLPLVGGLPPFQDESQKLGKVLKTLRRAAGVVRDLDVQQDLVAKEGESLAQGGASAQKEARALQRTLNKRRNREADKLVDLLQAIHGKLPKRLKALLDALEPAQSTSIPEASLTALIRDLYTEETRPYLASDPENSDDPDRLHSIRKVAKLARYLAETAPDGARRAHELAEEFESIQQSGGEWHDWMVLSELAASELGENAQLPQRFAMHASHALSEFQKRLH